MKLMPIIFAGLVVLVAACNDPCVDLSHRVCRCFPNEQEQRSCITEVDNQADKADPSEEELKVCSDKLETCSCERLASGDFAACGLAHE